MMNTIVILLFSILVFVTFAEAQPKAITKEEYERQKEKAREAMTYPYRETIKFEPYTDFDSPEALHSDSGVEVLSSVVLKEYSAADRLRITIETETDKGKTVVQQMQIHSDCYTLVGTQWKKNTESCGNAFAVAGVRPDKEEYFAGNEMVDGVDVRVFRYVQTNRYGREEKSFTVDAKGRLIKETFPEKDRTYEYDVKIKPIVVPRKSRVQRKREGI